MVLFEKMFTEGTISATQVKDVPPEIVIIS